jgi:hypothetical protein
MRAPGKGGGLAGSFGLQNMMLRLYVIARSFAKRSFQQFFCHAGTRNAL